MPLPLLLLCVDTVCGSTSRWCVQHTPTAGLKPGAAAFLVVAWVVWCSSPASWPCRSPFAEDCVFYMLVYMLEWVFAWLFAGRQLGGVRAAAGRSEGSSC
jgi:hypothetical protein